VHDFGGAGPGEGGLLQHFWQPWPSSYRQPVPSLGSILQHAAQAPALLEMHALHGAQAPAMHGAHGSGPGGVGGVGAGGVGAGPGEGGSLQHFWQPWPSSYRHAVPSFGSTLQHAAQAPVLLEMHALHGAQAPEMHGAHGFDGAGGVGVGGAGPPPHADGTCMS